MILIADSGSTKCDWIILDTNHEVVKITQTIGLNPYFIDTNFVVNEVTKNKDLNAIKDQVSQVFFYGAGCSMPVYKKVIKDGLDQIFTTSKTIVGHDLAAAAYAAYRGEPVLVCITGTGSNACFFDGKTIREEAPSLSFILGDEASGNWLGKQVLRGYFYKTMPEHLRDKFKEKYNLDVYQVNKKIYKENRANAFLASFSEFVGEHKEDAYFREIIEKGFQEFFDFQVHPFPESKKYKINFIGSIAHHYEDILKHCAKKNGLEIGAIIRKPIYDLADYHKKYILT